MVSICNAMGFGDVTWFGIPVVAPDLFQILPPERSPIKIEPSRLVLMVNHDAKLVRPVRLNARSRAVPCGALRIIHRFRTISVRAR